MPNWIINRLVAKASPDRIRQFLGAIRSDRQRLDFERIIPSPEVIRRAGRVWGPPGSGQLSGAQYFISEVEWRDFTPEEEKELEALGCRSWEGWSFANWGTNKIAFEVEVDESTVDLGHVIISFETAWSPPVRILERLREMFPDIAFGCEWFPEDEFFYRYHPSQSAAIARSEREQPGEHIVATLYLTKAEYPDFFLETLIIAETGGQYPRERSMIQPMTRGEARQWMLASDVKLLALLYPELGKAEPSAVGGDEPSTPTADKPVAGPNHENLPGDIPF
jgi:hypothetical protein